MFDVGGKGQFLDPGVLLLVSVCTPEELCFKSQFSKSLFGSVFDTDGAGKADLRF